MEIDKDWLIDCYRLSDFYLNLFGQFLQIMDWHDVFSMVLLSHSITDMQSKYQQADTKRTRTITEIIWYFYRCYASAWFKGEDEVATKVTSMFVYIFQWRELGEHLTWLDKIVLVTLIYHSQWNKSFCQAKCSTLCQKMEAFRRATMSMHI